jgi:phage shock protein A
MSDKKPGLFSRIRNSISSTLNEAVDSMSDPGNEIALMLDDLAAQIQSSEADLKQAMVDRKVMERKAEEATTDAKKWEKKAEQALKLGDENLAREALRRKADYDIQVKDLTAGVSQQQDLVDGMTKNIKEAKARLKSLNLRRGSLMAQARAAKKGVPSGQLGDGGGLDRLNAIEGRIAELEAFNEVAQELGGNTAEEAAIEAKLADLEGESEVDDALAALKAKMAGAQKSLPKADD